MIYPLILIIILCVIHIILNMDLYRNRKQERNTTSILVIIDLLIILLTILQIIL